MENAFRLSDIFNIQEELVCRFSSDLRFSYVNEPFCRFAGLSEDQLLGVHLLDLLPAGQRRLRRAIKKMMQDPQRMVFKNQSVSSTGAKVWQQWVGIPILDSEGKILEIQASCRDITRPKALEKMIKAQRDLAMSLNEKGDPEALYQVLLKALGQVEPFQEAALFTIDENLRQFRLVQSAGSHRDAANGFKEVPWESPFGRMLKSGKRTVLEGREFYQLQEELQKFTSATLVMVEPVLIEGKVIANVVLLSNSASTISPETLRLLDCFSDQIGSVLDGIQKRSEFQVTARNLDSLLATISDMLLLISPEGMIFKANPAVSEKLGYSMESIIGKPIQIFLPPEFTAEMDQILQKISQIKSGSFRLPFVTLTGELCQIEMDLSYGIWDQKDMIVAICRDITYRVEIEKSEREQRVLASALADVATILNSSLNIEEVIDRILENVGNVIPNTSCNIMFIEGNQARIVRSRGYDTMGTEELLMVRVFELKKINSLYKMAYSLQPTVIEDTATDANWSLIPEALWVRSYVAAPITFQGKLFGFINCDSDQAGFYNRGHALKLKLFADQAGIAMENAMLYSETRRHARQMTLINDLTRVSLNSDDFSKLLENLPARLLDLFQAQNVYITRLDEATREVHCIATTHPLKSNYLNQMTESGGKSLTGTCLEAGKAVFRNNSQNSDPAEKKKKRAYPEKNLLALPMLTKGKKIGAIIVGFGGNYSNSEVDIAIGEYAANQIAPVISKMVSLDRERSQSEQLGHTNTLIAALSRVGTSIVSASDTSTVMNSLGTELEKIGIHSMIALAEGDPSTQQVLYISQEETILPAIEKLLPERLPVYKIPIEGFSFSTRVFQDGRPQFIEDPESIVLQLLPEILHPFKRQFFSILSIHKETRAVILPLSTEAKVIGILVLWGDNMKEADTEAFSIFGYQTSAALENAALLEKIKRMAVTDEMTGIYNRRGINEYGQHEVEAAHRFSRPLSAIMFDLDHFKVVNDTYGHPIGDQVLCEIVKRCKERVREIDLFGRYGGEEFLLLIIGSGMKQASIIAECLRSAVEATPVHTDVGDLNVTISLGVAELSAETRTIDDMIKAADVALYQAKINGRNIVATVKETGNEGDDSHSR